MTAQTPLGQTNTHINAYLKFHFPQIYFWMESEIQISKWDGEQCKKKNSIFIEMSIKRSLIFKCSACNTWNVETIDDIGK